MTLKEKGSWLIGSVAENAWNLGITTALGSAALALAPILKRIALIAWNSPQTPIPLTPTWARISLGAVVVIALTTVWLVRVAWRQGRELIGLRGHKCPSSGGPKSYPGPAVWHLGVKWPTMLRYTGDVSTDTITVGLPECPDCRARLMIVPPKMAHCPTCAKRYPIGDFASAHEGAKGHVLGMRNLGNLIFPGEPNPPKPQIGKPAIKSRTDNHPFIMDDCICGAKAVPFSTKRKGYTCPRCFRFWT